MIKLHKINFPKDCELIHHEFHSYDPQNSFTEADSIKYLHEDLLQCYFEEDNLIIDLGWYGNLKENRGEFKIQLIKDENWEIPFEVICSKSMEDIMTYLLKILKYYTSNTVEE